MVSTPSKRHHGISTPPTTPGHGLLGDINDARGTYSPVLDPELKARLASSPMRTRHAVATGYQRRAGLPSTRSEPSLSPAAHFPTSNPSGNDVIFQSAAETLRDVYSPPRGLQPMYEVINSPDPWKQYQRQQQQQSNDFLDQNHPFDNPFAPSAIPTAPTTFYPFSPVKQVSKRGAEGDGIDQEEFDPEEGVLTDIEEDSSTDDDGMDVDGEQGSPTSRRQQSHLFNPNGSRQLRTLPRRAVATTTNGPTDFTSTRPLHTSTQGRPARRVLQKTQSLPAEVFSSSEGF